MSLVDDVSVYMIIGVLFLVAVVIVLEGMMLAARRGPVVKCTTHAWDYRSNGEMYCTECNKNAEDILNDK